MPLEHPQATQISSDMTRALQEEVHQLDAKAAFSLKNISKEVVDTSTWLTTMDASVKEQCKELKGFRAYLSGVDSFLRSNSGAIRVEIEDSQRWKAGDIAILWNQEARTVRFIGSLLFDQPLRMTILLVQRNSLKAAHLCLRQRSCNLRTIIQTSET